jgi:hypothetical protein
VTIGQEPWYDDVFLKAPQRDPKAKGDGTLGHALGVLSRCSPVPLTLNFPKAKGKGAHLPGVATLRSALNPACGRWFSRQVVAVSSDAPNLLLDKDCIATM